MKLNADSYHENDFYAICLITLEMNEIDTNYKNY